MFLGCMQRVAIAAIATVALSQSAALADSWEKERDAALACSNEVARDPAFRALNEKLSLFEPTISQLADESLPTVEEVPIIRQRAERLQACRDTMLVAVRRHHPYLAPVLELRNFKFKIVYVELTQRRISYGNANRLLHEAWLEARAAEAQYDRARTEAERRALAESFGRMDRQVRSPPPGTGRMTCRWVGSTLYCDPY